MPTTATHPPQLIVQLRRAALLAELPDPRTRRLIRELAGVSQKSLALDLGVDQGTVSRYESGTRLPRKDALIRYTLVLQALARAVEDRGE